MSFSSKADQASLPISGSEVDSSIESDFSPLLPGSAALRKSVCISTPVEDFRRSLQNEKNFRRHLAKRETLPVARSIMDANTMELFEKNYKLQVQTLLEEVNQLKLEKKIIEKKMERSHRDVDSPSKFRSVVFNDGLDESIIKRTIEAKSSTIRELEFQISQLKQDNKALRLKTDGQAKQIEELVKRIMDSENLKELIEEKDEEISRLRENFEAEALRNDKLTQELSYIKNENLALKLKNLCPNCGQSATGAYSFINPHCNCASKDLSFFSSIDKCGHYRPSSDAKFIGKILNFSELDGDLKNGNTNSPRGNKGKIPLPSPNRIKDITEEDTYRSKSELNQLQNLSVKVLSDYEEGLRKEKKSDIKKDPKTLERIIEVNKIKSYVIDEQNKKLLSLLKAGNDKAQNIEVQKA